MKKIKDKIKKIKDGIVNFNYKQYISTNRQFIAFVISNVINAWLLRFFTVHNYFAIKPFLADLAIVLILGSFVYLFKAKKQFTYLMILSIIFNIICIVNSLYYTYYMSFVSVSLIAVSLTVVDVGDAVIQNVLQVKDFIFLWQLIFLSVYHIHLKKKKYIEFAGPKENRKKRFTGTLICGVIIYALFFATVTSVEFSRLSKQWNREFLVTKFGVYTYQLNDLFKSLDAKFNTLFGYDNAAKEFRDYYEENTIELKNNEYTNTFDGKNLIVIHAESIQNAAINQEFNGEKVAPFFNKIKDEGIYFSNFYSQASSGTSSDSEFTFSTSLLPVTNGSVAVSYWNREYETLQRMLRDKGYNTLSFHANNGDFWNRNNLHKSLGYNTFYSKSSFKVDEENIIGLGLSDKEFFKQAVPILKKEYDENGKFMATLIMLSNHTPFDEIEKYGEFDTDIKEEVDGEIVSYPYMEDTKLGNYFKSVHYADEALGEFITALEEEGILDNTVLVIYGDHDARLPKSDYRRLYNYDKETDSTRDCEEGDDSCVIIDSNTYELLRKVPFIIYSKETKESLHTEVTDVMGMYDCMPTLGNMFGFYNKYALGHDIFDIKDNNIVVFPNGNWVTNKIYYNSQNNTWLPLKETEIEAGYIEANNLYTEKLLSASNATVVFDLIKNARETEEAESDYIEEKVID